jgi:SAM-dependent methyltransferase
MHGFEYYLAPAVAARYDADPDLPSEDVAFYVDLARRHGKAGVLELGCGTGRITLPIAEAGLSIAGLDAAAPMLEVARRRSSGRDNPRWLLDDMADFDLGERFSLVIIPYRSFCLLDARRMALCLSRVHEHLLAGGRFALDYFNPLLLARAARLSTVPRADYADPDAVVSEPAPGLRLLYPYPLAMRRLLDDAGFAVEASYGDFDRSPFTPESRNLVWLCRRL